MPWSPQTVCVSAPGKVLVAGGYLVLDRQHEGLVLATSSRFYCVAQPSTTPAGSNTDSNPTSATITVSAAQFPAQSSWSYHVELVVLNPGFKEPNVDSNKAGAARSSGATEPNISLTQLNPENGSNKFIEITLAKALHVAWEMLSQGIRGGDAWINGGKELIKRIRGAGAEQEAGGLQMFVMADNDFYSQREQLSQRGLPRSFDSLSKLPPFNPLPRPVSQTNKTGLGSSAALTTSLTAGLLLYLGLIDLQASDSARGLKSGSSFGTSTPPSPLTTSSLDLVHALAQYSHCFAQGKIGSGFDVSSAVYGSHSYRRFSPSILAPLLAIPHLPIRPSPLLPHLDRQQWDQQTLPLRLPRGLRLVLADVDAGTDTPSFVSKVLEWKKREPGESGKIFEQLDTANMRLKRELQGMVDMEDAEGYDEFLQRYSSYPIDEVDKDHPIGRQIANIQSIQFIIRQIFRLTSAASDVPIEPPEQARLLRACEKLPGVIGGGVPGAGGYDALYLLIIDTPSVIKHIEQLWAGWEEMSVCPLQARQSDGGLVKEHLDDVEGLTTGIARWQSALGV